MLLINFFFKATKIKTKYLDDLTFNPTDPEIEMIKLEELSILVASSKNNSEAQAILFGFGIEHTMTCASDYCELKFYYGAKNDREIESPGSKKSFNYYNNKVILDFICKQYINATIM